mmetsp:Transcript_35221/g.80390  ORF Transcript_35221/g.80390 Transcript_35221/m.80390 type:complete len:202 (-) Transcript_35221:879-1484(-)
MLQRWCRPSRRRARRLRTRTPLSGTSLLGALSPSTPAAAARAGLTTPGAPTVQKPAREQRPHGCGPSALAPAARRAARRTVGVVAGGLRGALAVQEPASEHGPRGGCVAGVAARRGVGAAWNTVAIALGVRASGQLDLGLSGSRRSGRGQGLHGTLQTSETRATSHSLQLAANLELCAANVDSCELIGAFKCSNKLLVGRD